MFKTVNKRAWAKVRLIERSGGERWIQGKNSGNQEYLQMLLINRALERQGQWKLDAYWEGTDYTGAPTFVSIWRQAWDLIILVLNSHCCISFTHTVTVFAFAFFETSIPVIWSWPFICSNVPFWFLAFGSDITFSNVHGLFLALH